MDLQTIFLAISGGCLLIAILWSQMEKVEKAATRNVKTDAVHISLECDAAPALEALKQVQAEAERAEAAVNKAQKAVKALRTEVASQKPPRRSPPAPPPMQDEYFRGPAKKKPAKR